MADISSVPYPLPRVKKTTYPMLMLHHPKLWRFLLKLMKNKDMLVVDVIRFLKGDREEIFTSKTTKTRP